MNHKALILALLVTATFAASAVPTAGALRCEHVYDIHIPARASCERDVPLDPDASYRCRVGYDDAGCSPGPSGAQSHVDLSTDTPVGPGPDPFALEETAYAGPDGPPRALYCGLPASSYVTYLDYSNSPSGVLVGTGSGTTDGPDLVIGSPYADQIHTGGGDDCVLAGDGGDHVFGGEGNDHIYGEEGDDRLAGDSYAFASVQRCKGELEIAGNNRVVGGPGQDRLYGCSGTDTLIGGTERDHLYGFGGVGDSLRGGSGNDVIVAGHPGDNDAQPPAPGGAQLVGNDGDDELHGSAWADKITGGIGEDVLYGYGGDDFLYGNEDYDIIHGGDGEDSGYGGHLAAFCYEDVEVRTDCES